MKFKRSYCTFLLALIFFAQKQAVIAQMISTEQNYAMNTPGIVMVQAVFSATVHVKKLNMNQPMFNRLVDSVKRLDTTGQILSSAQKLDFVVKALYKSPFRFFSAA